MKLASLLISFVVSLHSFTQNPNGFDEMVDSYLEKSVPLAKPTQLKFELSKNKSLVVLDARELKEFEVSHIKGARHVGHDNFDYTKMSDIDKGTKIYVYCSIGYRSEKIGKQLLDSGYTKVYNVYGGLFSWANAGYPLENASGKATRVIHGFSRDWAKWINKDRCSKTLK